MALKVINFDLNFVPQGVPPIVHIHQYDLGEIVTLRSTLYYGKDLYDGMDLSSCEFIVAYRRPDGSKQSYTITNHTFADPTILEFPLDANMTAMHGPNVMSLGFVDANTANILWTQNFILYVERHPIQADDYIGSSAYDGMIRILQAYVDEAYSATPEGYEEHIAKMREVEDTIDKLKQDIRDNLDEANEYTDQQMASLDSVYATLQDVIDAQNEGREYAGQLVGDTETKINSDMSLLYQTKDEAANDKTDLQIYAEQVSESSATEIKEYLGLDYTSSEPGLTETGLLNTVITQTAEGIVQEATAEFMTESEAEGIITSQVDSKVEQKAGEIVQTVEQLYETKADATQKLSDAQSYARSQISQKAGEITTTVKAYTDDSISNLKIGAQNLLRGTNEYKTTDESNSWVPTYNNGGWKATGTVTASELDDNPGNGFTVGAKIQNGSLSQNSIDFLVNKKAYVVHMYFKGSGLPDPHGEKAAIDSALKNIVYFRNTATGNKLVLDYATETDQETGEETVIRNQSFNYHYPYKEVVTYPTYTEEDEQGNQVTKVRKQVDYVEITDSPWRELEWYILCDEWPENVDIVVDSPNGTLDVCGIKMEEGSKDTAWQPNEFDIKKYTNTQIQQTNERISLIAAAQDTTNGNVSALSGRLDVEAGKISQLVQGGYLSPDGEGGYSVTSADTLVNRAVTNIATAYNIDANTIQGINNRIDATDEGIELTSRQMRSLGVENLIRSTDLCKELASSANATWALADEKHGWQAAGSVDSTPITRIDLAQTDRPFNNVTRAWKFVTASNKEQHISCVRQNAVPVTYQKTYTISLYARCTAGKSMIRLGVLPANASSDSSQHFYNYVVDSTNNSSWTLFSYTFTHDFEATKNACDVRIGITSFANTSATVEICAMKLELGEVPTTWCPSVFDVEAYAQASIKVATDSITENVEDLQGNYSELKQRADSFDLTLGTIAGENLIENSAFESNYTGHGPNPSSGWSIGTLGGKTCLMCTGAFNTTKYVSLRPFYRPKKGDIYTFSVDIYLSNFVAGTTNCYVALYKSGKTIDGTWRTSTIRNAVNTVSKTSDKLDNQNGKGWVRSSITFEYTADYDWGQMEVVVYARDFTGTFGFRHAKLERGENTNTIWTDTDGIIAKINANYGGMTIDGNKLDITTATAFSNLKSTVDGNTIADGTLTRLYYLKSNSTAPSLPTAQVTSTSTSSGVWTTKIPSYITGYYYFTCEQYKLINGTYKWTPAQLFRGTIIDGNNIYTGTISADKLAVGTGKNLQHDYDDFSQIIYESSSKQNLTWYTSHLGDVSMETYYTRSDTVALPPGIPTTTRIWKTTLKSTASANTYREFMLGSEANRYGRIYLDPNKYYRISFYYMSNSTSINHGTQINLQYRAYRNATETSNTVNTTYNIIINKALTPGTSWQRASYSIGPSGADGSVNSNFRFGEFSFGLRASTVTGAECMYITALQVEEVASASQQASPWSKGGSTVIDGGHINTDSLTTDQIHLGGQMTVYNGKTSSTVGGYFGYGWGSDGASSTQGMALRSSNGSHYLHLSTAGAVLHANTYMQLYCGGTQMINMNTNYGLNIKTLNNSGDPKIVSSRSDGSTAAPLTIQCDSLTIKPLGNNIWFSQSSNGTEFFLQPRASDYTGSVQHGNLGSAGGYQNSNYSTWWKNYYGKAGLYTDSWTKYSDRRGKKEIEYTVPDIIDELKPVTYRLVHETEENQLHYGFIAQDVLWFDDNIVKIIDDQNPDIEPRLSLDYIEVVPLLVDKCHKLQKQIDELKGESS